MSSKFGNILASIASIVVGLLTIYVTIKYLSEPQGPMDWAVLLLSGATTGIITFIMVWGHFQSDPKTDPAEG